MRTSLITCGALLLAFPQVHGKADSPDFSSQIEKMKPSLIETRRHFHAHPELSNREVETGKEIARRLEAMGYVVKRNVAGNGVVTTLKGGKPGALVAYRADIDALPIEEANDLPFKSRNPGVMHACGHDMHTTVALGVAELLMKNRAAVPGEIRFIFQPSEEGAPAGERGGASLMIEEGVLEPKPAAIFGLHVMPGLHAGDVAWRSGPFMAAAVRFSIKIKGKKAHGANPHDGVDAIYVASQVVNGLQGIVSRQTDSRKALVISIGQFHAGNRWNILADEAVLEGTVRTLDPDVHSRIKADMERVMGGITSAYAAGYEFTAWQDIAPVVVNASPVSEQSAAALERALGKDHVKPTNTVMVSEDFAFFSQRVPALFFVLGVGNPEKGMTGNIHTPQFQADEDALTTGVKAMAAVLLARSAQR